MLDKIKDKIVKNKKAFTLIEALITLALFSVVVLIATNIYMSVISIQTRVVSLQKIQEDVRFLMESMTQSIRLGTIYYVFYDPPNNIDLHRDAATKPNILALIDQTGDYIFYGRTGDTLKFCQGTLTDCNYSEINNWPDITPKGVKVTDLKFIITPSADPFRTNVVQQSCGDCTGAYLSYRCKSNPNPPPAQTCQYYSDGHKFQPKVKIILKTESQGERMAEKASIHLQTTISTRIPQFEVKNLNYD